jgi:hypothetical protein
MAEVLRGAEASVTRALEKEEVGRAKAAPTPASDEVEIFLKGRGRRDSDREESAVPTRTAEQEVYSPNVTAAGVSVRRGGQLPTHPSASTFRLGHFLRSWQGSVGALLLLMAFGVTIFALMRGGAAPRNTAQPTPTPTAPQPAAQQIPLPLPTTPAPSPAFPTPDPQGLVPVPDQTYALPNGAGQPYYVSPGPVAPVASDAPRELTVVSESGATSAQDTGQSGRRAGANDSSARGGARNNNASETDAARTARTPEPEQPRTAPTAATPNQTPPPAPQPTPGRAKVIQWPPQ